VPGSRLACTHPLWKQRKVEDVAALKASDLRQSRAARTSEQLQTGELSVSVIACEGVLRHQSIAGFPS
jgi:hypothetical protein